MSIINIGATANDGTGDPLRSAFRKINTFHSVISRTASVPGSPSNGDLYIVPSGATGAWSGQQNKFAWFNGSSWEFYSPTEGIEVWVRDVDQKWRFNSTWSVVDEGSSTQINLVGVNNVYMVVASNAAQAVGVGATVTVAFDNVILDPSNLWDIVNDRSNPIPSSLNGKVALFLTQVVHTADGSGNIETSIQVSSDGGSSWATFGFSGLQGEQFGIQQTVGINALVTGNLYRVRHFSSAAKTIRGDALTFLRVVILDTANGNTSKPVRTLTGSGSLVAGDTNGVVICNSGSPNTLILPANSTQSIAVGSEIVVIQQGSGTTTISAAPGVSLRGVSEGSAAMSGPWAEVTLRKIGTDSWTINGEHGAVS